jgi:hypothetical protein
MFQLIVHWSTKVEFFEEKYTSFYSCANQVWLQRLLIKTHLAGDILPRLMRDLRALVKRSI